MSETDTVMFKVTKAAAAELKRSMAHHDFDDMPLRVAAQRLADGSVEYQMGFDEAGPGDVMVASSGIDVVIAKDHQPVLNGTELDFVALEDAEAGEGDLVEGDGEDGKRHFIFKNPNDANFVAPDESAEDSDVD